MSSFDTYTCVECGTEFKTHPSSRAAATEYCSPLCESTDRRLGG